MSEETVYEKGFKAYAPGMTCRGKQYVEGETYEESGGDLCGPGMMHYCVNPFDVLAYYPLINDKGEISEFSTVEALDPPKKDRTKSATKKLRIGAKLGLDGFVKACVDFSYEKNIEDMPKDDVSSGNDAKIGSSGNDAKIGSSGDDAKIGSSGRYAQIGSSGDDAVVICEKGHAVVACAGKRGKVKGPVGTWITLAEYGGWDGSGYPCICVKSAKIDGEELKADTFYTLKNGEFVEVPDAEG